MKEFTKFKCKCENGILKEYWGTDKNKNPEWRLTCQKCGYEEVISEIELKKREVMP